MRPWFPAPPLRTLLVTLILLHAGGAAAEMCRAWTTGETIGELDPEVLWEASGIAVSRAYPGSLYHHNDSGRGRYLYRTGPTGEDLHRLTIRPFETARHDMEDIALAPCPDGEPCVYVGDIGDNVRTRDVIHVYVIRESDMQTDGSDVRPLQTIFLAYPDGPRDAEAMAVHPNGDIFILTKEVNPSLLDLRPRGARMYRVPRDAWQAQEGRDPLTMEFVGEIPLHIISGLRATPLGWMATAMDMTPDGSRFLVLTYDFALEFAIDLADGLPDPEDLVEGVHYTFIPLARLPQQEAIAYEPGERSFLFTTELRPPLDTVPIRRVVCLDPPPGDATAP